MKTSKYHSYYKVPYLNIKHFNPIEEDEFGNQTNLLLLNLIPKSKALEFCGIPVENYSDMLCVAVAEPSLELKNKIESYTKKIVRFIRARKEDILEHIETIY